MSHLKAHYQVYILAIAIGLLTYQLAHVVDVQTAPQSYSAPTSGETASPKKTYTKSYSSAPNTQYAPKSYTPSTSYSSPKTYSNKSYTPSTSKPKTSPSSAPKCSYDGDYTNDAPGCH